MTALTLAMNEVQGVNSEEFLAVRAYHSLGVGFRHVLHFNERNLLSSASSVSSGVESYATTESERNFKDSGSDSGSEPEQKCKDNPADNCQAIIYDGRNILDLAKNIKPFTWQLSSFTRLSSPGFCFFKTPSKALHVHDSDHQSAPKKCHNCSFSAPIDRRIRKSRR